MLQVIVVPCVCVCMCARTCSYVRILVCICERSLGRMKEKGIKISGLPRISFFILAPSRKIFGRVAIGQPLTQAWWGKKKLCDKTRRPT